MHGLLHTLRGLRQGHQQAYQHGTLLRAVAGMLKDTSRSRLETILVVLLTPYGRHAIDIDLTLQDALNALIKGFGYALAGRLIEQIALVRCTAVADVVKDEEDVGDGIVVEGNVGMITLRVGPNLRPPTILVLSVEDVLQRLEEGLAETLLARRLIQSCQENHLRGGGSVVDGRVVGVALGLHDLLTFAVGQTAHHIGILGPGSRHTLIEQNLVTDARSLLRLEELLARFAHHIALRTQALGLGHRGRENPHKQKRHKGPL